MKQLYRMLHNRLEFRQQLILAFSIGIVLLALISSFAVSLVARAALEKQWLQQGQQITAAFADLSRLALLYQSSDNAEDAAATTLAYPDVLGVTVFDLQRDALLHKGSPSLISDDSLTRNAAFDALESTRLQTSRNPNASPANSQLFDWEQDNRWYFVAPVYAGNNEASPYAEQTSNHELIGYVQVIIGKQALQALGRQILLSNLSIGCLLALLLLALLLTITNRVAHPIRELAKMMGRAQQGDLDVRTALSGPKDIIAMGRAFNQMIAELAVREQELKKARDTALSLARIKSEFAATVSHELRTPMNGIMGMLELLQGRGLKPQQQEYLDIARSSGDALLTLIDDILDFSKIESGKMKIQPDNYYLRDMLDEIIELLEPQATQKELTLRLLVAPDIPLALFGDAGRIRQILINLISNAIKFTEEGGIEVRVTPLEGDSPQLHFAVSDSGIGIPDADIHHIFDAFSQADSSITRKYGGTGLGLAISRQLTELMQGDIGASSEPGKGSTFWFHVPLVKALQLPENRSDTPLDISGLRVLVAINDNATRDFLKQTFADWEAYLRFTNNAGQALAMLHKAHEQGKPYELLVVDNSVQGLSAPALCSQVQREPAFAELLQLLLGENDTVAMEIQSRTVHQLSKPLQPSALLDAIVALMKHHQPCYSALPGSSDTHYEALNAHILIVEDNRSNQYVARGLLERLGCSAETVSSGADALQRLARSDGPALDLILMDCRMPGLDGFETTRQMRQLDNSNAQLPIIAMTADVGEEIAQLCASAGMDDCLAKPLSLVSLHQALQRFITTANEPTESLPVSLTGAAPPAADAASDRLHLQEPIVDQQIFERLQSQLQHAFRPMIIAFLEDSRKNLAALQRAVQSHDSQSLSNLTHCLKGGALNLGAQRLAHSCQRLDSLLEKSPQHCARQIDQLQAEFGLLENLLESKLLLDKSAAPFSAHSAQREAALQPSFVLVVDDDRAVRHALRAVLEQEGMRVEEASNGVLATALCERQMPDLIIMDAVMPEMDGFAACHEIRQLAHKSPPPILMVTALNDEASVERAFAAGAADFISKPINFAVLRQRSKRLLSARFSEQQAHHLAYNDSLTGLPNRPLFIKRSRELLQRAQLKGSKIALMMLDLDRFKMVNDSMGHEAGDLLIKAVAKRINGCVRNSDLVARLGGDEFTLLLDRINSAEAAQSICEKVCAALSQPFTLMKRDIYMPASIGIACYPDDGEDISSLMQRADTAMYKAKSAGGARFQFYQPGMEAAMAKRLELEGEMRQALARKEFTLHYQPQLDTLSGELIGMEALVRWQHPQRGLVPPLDFIPMAEETGLINELGEWVLREACRQTQRWRDEGLPDLVVAVNISSKQIESGQLLSQLQSALSETALPAHCLELEITESTIMEHADAITSVLQQLKAQGVSLAIDDFGTGYSSLSYLRHFPVDTLKIDRSFVKDIVDDQDSAAIICGIIELGHSLRLKIVAEGVELDAQEQFLREHCCDISQGYLISKPLPAESFKQFALGHRQQHHLRELK